LIENSPIADFLEKNPAGGIHHMCFEVNDMQAASQRLAEVDIRVLGNGTPKVGAHRKPVIFAHPKNFQGALLVEFEQARLQKSPIIRRSLEDK
jgi:methylmalonyl-CoA/ethylmalonyl-CoA epimerase